MDDEARTGDTLGTPDDHRPSAEAAAEGEEGQPLANPDAAPAAPRPGPAADLYETLLHHLAAHDKAAFVRTAVESVTTHTLEIPALYRDVLTPLLRQMGAQWQHGHARVWEEHMASAMVRTVVEILYPGVLKAKAARPPAGHGVLLASPPDEGHDLGLRMVADRFDMAGWSTYFLGADTPIEEMVDAALALHVDGVVLSSATHFHRLALRGHVDFLRHALPDTAIWVGGSAFAFDSEGWGADELPDLEELLEERPAPEPDWEWEEKE
jgi:methanogenic corrinoid protein MtbC1